MMTIIRLESERRTAGVYVLLGHFLQNAYVESFQVRQVSVRSCFCVYKQLCLGQT